MLMHADYFSPSRSRIRIFTDHIEFYNPGGLPKPLSELKDKDISMPRNPIITKLFRMVKLAENAGYGLDKIETNWKAYNNTSPEYDIAFDSTILKLTLYDTEKSKVKHSDDMLELIRNNPAVTIPEMANELKVSSRTIERYLKRMQDEKLIKRIGPTKNGIWKIL